MPHALPTLRSSDLVNSETDFVAKDENFIAFTEAVGQAALAAADVEALKATKLPAGETVEETRAVLIAKVGENVQVRRMVRIDSPNRSEERRVGTEWASTCRYRW